MARILVADDNSNIQKMVALALQEQGVEVIGVGNGEAAVRKVPELRPDVILADVFMPVRSGYEVCEFVKNDSRFSQIPVVLLVGAFDPLDEHEAQRVRADGVLKKPFVPPDPLVNLVKALLVKSAGEKLVAVGVPAASVAATAQTTKTAPKTREPEISDGPDEEFATARPSVKIAEHNKPAFSSLLETPTEEPAALDQNDPILTAPRDPHLGEPAFWARPPQAPQAEAPPVEEEDPTEHSWGRSESLPGMDETAVLDPEETVDLDRDVARVRALEFPTAQEELAPAAELESVAEEFAAPQETQEEPALTFGNLDEAQVTEELKAAPPATVIEWPRAEEEIELPAILQAPAVAEPALDVPSSALSIGSDLDLEAPIGSEPPAVWPSIDPSLETTAAQAAERQALLEAAAKEAEEAASAVPEPEAPLAVAEPEPEQAEHRKHSDDVTSAWPPVFVPATMPAEPVPVLTATPAGSAAKWASLDEPLPPATAPAALAGIPHATLTVPYEIPQATSQTVPQVIPQAIPSAIRPPIPPVISRAVTPVETPAAAPIVSTPAPRPEDAGQAAAIEAAAPVAISPEIIDTVVNRIVDRMQPQVLELITREILRPVVEALVRREIEKK